VSKVGVMTLDADVVVAGAGVVGLAVARALAMAGREVIVIEAAEGIGTETSSRNSEVIHAGIYYPQGSLKAKACVRGKWLLYEYAQSRGVGFARCGKLIVATSEAQLEKLDGIRARAAANDVPELHAITAAEAIAMEPNLSCVGALYSPTTGILDSHGYMLALQGEAEDHGAAIAFNTKIASGALLPDGRVELVCDGAEPCVLRARLLVNCAGLHAQALAARIEGFPAAQIPKWAIAKGNYFQLAGASPFSRLIYPAPEPGGLGVHITIDLGGQARFGPDVEWIEAIDYRVDPARADTFYAAVRRYWPGLKDGALQPAYAGIRPKLVGPGEPDADFCVLGPADHGVEGIVHMFGIESPGLTASLALAELALAKVRGLAAQSD